MARHAGVWSGREEMVTALAKSSLGGFRGRSPLDRERGTGGVDDDPLRCLILDLGLPDGDGLSIVRELRHRNDPIPVLVLTARGGVHDRVSGLRGGADDYLVKPFAFDELVARLHALLRRPGQLLGSSLRLANVVFDTESRQTFIDGKPEILSSRETAVLELLMRRAGSIVPKKLVEDHIFGIAGDVASNAVEVYVHRLRKELADRRRR